MVFAFCSDAILTQHVTAGLQGENRKYVVPLHNYVIIHVLMFLNCPH